MRLTAQHYAQAWFEALSESKPKAWQQISQKFLQDIRLKGKLSWLNRILQIMQSLANQAQGQMAVNIISAHPIDTKFAQKLAQNLVKHDQVSITSTIDQTLLGGIIVQTENKQWNLTLANQIAQLEQTLLQ